MTLYMFQKVNQQQGKIGVPAKPIILNDLNLSRNLVLKCKTFISNINSSSEIYQNILACLCVIV